jgi:EAL domain-containing protein (putative c-di-GMP-specific phosphodiesterase class I)
MPTLNPSSRVAGIGSEPQTLAPVRTIPRLRRRHADRVQLLNEIIEERLLEAHFQPIVELRTGKILGYEGLIRGPAGSPLRAPVELFEIAAAQGQILRLERLCRQTVLESYAALGLPNKLFLNVRPHCLALPTMGAAGTADLLNRLGLKAERIVIELTENQPFSDYFAVREVLCVYRKLGFKIAIDDLGEGFASFRLWSELRPEYVKADMHFVQGIDSDPFKLEFLKAVQRIADTCGSLIVAEGVEKVAELSVIRDLGIAFGQGNLIAPPAPSPPRRIPEQVHGLLSHPYDV